MLDVVEDAVVALSRRGRNWTYLPWALVVICGLPDLEKPMLCPRVGNVSSVLSWCWVTPETATMEHDSPDCSRHMALFRLLSLIRCISGSRDRVVASDISAKTVYLYSRIMHVSR